MILIIGGAYQGKREYALANYPELELVDDFQEQLREHSLNCRDTLSFTREQLPILKDKVLVFEDIFCGVVPMDTDQRRYREDCGRAMALLAANAQEVIRVFCGIGSKLKG